MCEIPYGKTVTYGWIADKLAKERGLERMSAQAVGGAVGHNPICIIVPCHRVIGSNGNLTGYGGGILRKKALLELEGNSVKNHTDVLIFHTAICSGASQIALMADEKSPSRVSRRPVAQSAPEWRKNV